MAATIAKYIYRSSVVLFVGQTLLSATVNADCYALSGITAQQSQWYSGPELVSCGQGTNNCCLVGQRCGSNLLCLGEKLSREYCADPSWEGCSRMCPQGFNAGWGVQKCGNNTYCCGEGCDCKKGLYYIDPKTGEAMNFTDAKSISTETVSWWLPDSSASSSPTSKPATSSTSSVPAKTTSSSSSTTSAGSASSANSAPSGESSPSTEPQPSGFSGAVGVGIGLGSAAAFALIIGLVWFLLQRRKERLEIQKRKERAVDEVSQRNPFEDRAYPFENPPKMHEMDGVWPDHEIEGRNMPAPPRPQHEIDGTQVAPEIIAKQNYLRLQERDEELT
ncbi:hypothetical protein DM02DRAFT_727783 [Periconia macrospinosa]|uniref:Uncharacterized protein n=1 Tax=Periconia macrospinosa TaxID=97972 RepID=A0A2V1DU44_9PLEO|nr:hypothetical protein DM02DRAFT_727783 [Periconia macrospinosa]